VKKLVKITIFEHQQNGDPKWSFFFSRHAFAAGNGVFRMCALNGVVWNQLSAVFLPSTCHAF
jgi:hypothetical protein